MIDSTLPELELAQKDDYQGEDWWHWRVWLKGRASALNQVQRVVYQLHSTFPDPVREIDDREGSFGIDAEGWGGFTIHARVELKDGRRLRLKHNLTLRYPDGRATSA